MAVAPGAAGLSRAPASNVRCEDDCARVYPTAARAPCRQLGIYRPVARHSQMTVGHEYRSVRLQAPRVVNTLAELNIHED
jgi:hypothetical protein